MCDAADAREHSARGGAKTCLVGICAETSVVVGVLSSVGDAAGLAGAGFGAMALVTSPSAPMTKLHWPHVYAAPTELAA